MKKICLTVFCLAAAVLLAGGSPQVSDFTPDLSKSDIYLPHLKRLPLSGWWKLKKASSDRKNDPGDEGQKKRYFAADLDDSGWQDEIVPGDIHLPILTRLPPDANWNEVINAIPREVREWGGVAYLRKDFVAPEMEKNERAILFFDEIAGSFTLYVNGKKISGEHVYTPATEYQATQAFYQFDITDAIRGGEKNNITLRLFHNAHPLRWAWGGKAGILDRVYLDIRPAAYTANILVTPGENLKDVFFECVLAGSEQPGDTQGWRGEIFEWNSGDVVGGVAFGKPYEDDSLKLVSGTGRVENATPWSWKNPFLYGIRVKNDRGEVVGVQRFGIRTFGVADGHFMLNGKKVNLRGLCFGDEIPQTPGRIFANRLNYQDMYRNLWQLYRDAGINHYRLHSTMPPRGYCEILDEMGIMLTSELGYAETRIENPERADMIDVKGFDGACDAKGNLLPEFVRMMKARIRRSYSHPSVCTYSFGNEIRQYDDPRVEGLLNHLYDLFHRVDKQRRPVTNSSGRFWKDGSNVKEMREREKLDYIDTHDYTGSINNFPLAYCEPVARHFIDTVKKYYGKDKPPIMNGETVYMANHYFGDVFNRIWASEDAAQPDWDKMLYMLQQWPKDHPEQRFLSHYWVRNWGSRNYRFDRPLGRGIYTERILEAFRKCWPEYNGYETLSGDYFTIRYEWPYDKVEFRKNIAYGYLARVNSPVIAILDYIAPNRFTGESFKTQLHAINNDEATVNNLVFEAVVEQDGRETSRVTREIGTLESGGKSIQALEFKTPGHPGPARLVYRLTSDGAVVNERVTELRVYDRADLFRPIETKKKIALYDASSAFGGLKPYGTDKLLKAFAVPFRSIRSFDSLKEFDVLVIGAESIDGRVREGAEEIRAFVENGGRLLMFEQNSVGRIPFLTELEVVLAGPGQFSEILKADHPALASLKQPELFCWNQKDWSVYRNYIYPVSRAALLLGGDTTQWGADYFGMVAAHLKLGKGDVLLNQAEVTKCLKDDSGAARLARNLLNTVLDDATRSAASEFTGLPVLKTKPLDHSNAFAVDLRSAANRGFSDDVAGDGKGGWTDQGAINDLSPFPTGERVFNGIPFAIAVPEENGGRSCVVVSCNPQRKLPAESGPVAVGAKLKRLLFLHSGAWLGDKGDEIRAGEYVVNYRSGRSIVVPLVVGENIGDWWGASAKKLSDAECAWSGMNRSGAVGVYLYEWNNPNPDDPIRDIVLRGKNNAVIGLIGLTGEK